MSEIEKHWAIFLLYLIDTFNVQVNNYIKLCSFGRARTQTPLGPATVVHKPVSLPTDSNIVSTTYTMLEVLGSAVDFWQETNHSLRLMRYDYKKDCCQYACFVPKFTKSEELYFAETS